MVTVDEAFCDNVAKLMAFGLSQEQVAGFYGISAATLTNYKKAYPNLLKALESGRIKGLVTSSEALMKNIERRGCISSIRWYEATRHNLSEKIKTENETTVKVQSLEQYLREEKYVGSSDRSGQGEGEEKHVADYLGDGTSLVPRELSSVPSRTEEADST